MTTSGTTTDPPDAPDVLGPAPRVGALERVRRWASSLRVRILLRNVAVLTVATVLSIVVARQALVLRIDERLDEALSQEVAELRSLAQEVDPATGEPVEARVERVFRVYLERNVPSRGEAFLTFVDGEPFLRSAPVVPYRLDEDPALVERWAGIEETARGRLGTPAGDIEYLAVPLRVGGEAQGVFVVTFFRDFETREIREVTLALAGVGLVVVLIGSLVLWRGTGRTIAPVREVTRTARSISEGDLHRRIPVGGDAEIAELARTFNAMLDRLEAAFVTQRMFLDDAGHELRTPITIVRGHLELLDADPDERESALALVLDELDRMGRMVDDLLTLAKVQRPDFLHVSEVEVGALTDELLAKGAALGDREWRLGGRAEGPARLDRQRLTQAVMQLAQNAVEHTDHGATIIMSSERVGDEIAFGVHDSGPGVPLESQERIFERFARGPGARSSEGAGLGLSIVGAIARAHGGRVELESRPGRGARFTILVPIHPKEAPGS